MSERLQAQRAQFGTGTCTLPDTAEFLAQLTRTAGRIQIGLAVEAAGRCADDGAGESRPCAADAQP